MKSWNNFAILTLLVLFGVAFFERTLADLGPNRELITVFMVVSSLVLSRKNSLTLMALLLIGTDLVIGNTNIFLFTWSGFLLPLLLAPWLVRLTSSQAWKTMLFGTTFGLGSNIFFFLWTNFGVWLFDSWNMYPNTLAGLTLSYLNGLPFLRAQLTTTLIALPIGLGMLITAKALDHQFNLSSEKSAAASEK